MDCHFFLQGIFLTQGSNLRLLHLLHWQVNSLPVAKLGSPSTSSTNSKNLHTYAILLKKHSKSLYYQYMQGTSHCTLKEAEFHFQEGHRVLPPWMEQLPPRPHGSAHRGHKTAFLSHTQHMVDGPSIHCSACNETNITHAAQTPRHRPWLMIIDDMDLSFSKVNLVKFREV